MNWGNSVSWWSPSGGSGGGGGGGPSSFVGASPQIRFGTNTDRLGSLQEAGSGGSQLADAVALAYGAYYDSDLDQWTATAAAGGIVTLDASGWLMGGHTGSTPGDPANTYVNFQVPLSGSATLTADGLELNQTAPGTQQYFNAGYGVGSSGSLLPIVGALSQGIKFVSWYDVTDPDAYPVALGVDPDTNFESWSSVEDETWNWTWRATDSNGARSDDLIMSLTGGGFLKLVKTQEASATENLALFTLDGLGAYGLTMRNRGAVDSTFFPELAGMSTTTATGLSLTGLVNTDTGSNPAVQFCAVTDLSTRGAPTTRPAFGWVIGSGTAMTIDAKGATTHIVTHTDSAAEELARWRLDEDTNSHFRLLNASGTNAVLLPYLVGTSSGANQALILGASGTTDTGSASVMRFNVATVAGAAIQTRTLFDWTNNATAILQLLPLNSGANACLSWGTQNAATPSFTTRSNGTRVVLYSSVNASNVDSAIGMGTTGPWLSMPQANTTVDFQIYGGITSIFKVRGDGLVTTTGGQVHKYRTALTSPVTVAVTDWTVASNLSSAGAVAVNLPSSPATGTELYIQDDKGDAGVNNITITPAAGTINGAATYVINTNYGGARLIYNGTEWRASKLTA